MRDTDRSGFQGTVTRAVRAALASAVAFASATGWTHDTVRPLGGSLAAHVKPLALPAFKIVSPPDKVLSSSDLRGRVTVLNIWATWCGPCLRELASLDRLQQKLGDKVRVLAVSQDEAGERVVGPYISRMAASHLEVHYDTQGRLGSAFGTRVLPVTVIVDKEGRERARYVGELDWSAAAPTHFVSNLAEE